MATRLRPNRCHAKLTAAPLAADKGVPGALWRVARVQALARRAVQQQPCRRAWSLRTNALRGPCLIEQGCQRGLTLHVTVQRPEQCPDQTSACCGVLESADTLQEPACDFAVARSWRQRGGSSTARRLRSRTCRR